MREKNMFFSKFLVCAIVVLFVDISTMPLVGSLSLQNQVLTEKTLSDCSMTGDSGLSLITVKVIHEMGENGWYKSNIPFVITYESDYIASIYYSAYNEPFKKYIGPFYATYEGNDIRLKWYAVDYDGNQSEVDDPFVFDLDKTEPIVPEVITYKTFKVDGRWYINFSVECTDCTSGMDRVEWSLNDIVKEIDEGQVPYYNWIIPWSKDFKLPPVIFKATAYDRAGNSDYVELRGDRVSNVLEPLLFSSGFVKKNSYQSISSCASSTERVGTEKELLIEKPKSDCSKVGDFDIASLVVVVNRKMLNPDWVDGNASITLIPDNDDVTEVYYKLDNGEWILYSEPLVISEDGFHTFWWYILDDEGNTSTPDYIAFNIDQTSPEINLIKKRIDLDEVKFTANVKDDTSGINRVEFCEDNDLVFTDYDFPYEWTYTKFRNTKVEAIVFDNAGNSNSTSMNTWNNNNQHSSSKLFFQIAQRLLNTR